jgi:hypothetical protein
MIFLPPIDGTCPPFPTSCELLINPTSYQNMAQARNPYGDGQAAERIFRILARALAGQTSGKVLGPWEPGLEASVFTTVSGQTDKNSVE